MDYEELIELAELALARAEEICSTAPAHLDVMDF